ncbi:phosphatidylserine/phosphatidylglycerophosphate/cardiolipin synthase family protein [candidate division KSB1 bacterium]
MSPDSRDTIYLENKDLYIEIIENYLLNANKDVWIATANLKDMRIKYKGKFVSIVKVFSELVFRNVSIRLLHSSNPSKAYMSSLKRSTLEKQKNFNRIQCPRVHFKTVIIDHAVMYTGSANFTGAGLGYKSEKNRNFETGLLITDPVMIRNVEALFEKIWTGSYCIGCGRRINCPKPIK